ncbi:MAG: hypothetical protein NTW74_13575 [Acidobacteria bacterium]|nr:hypothetical protein [Acidobacteriota bacterium]
MSPTNFKGLSTVCFIAGFLSILASIAIWMYFKHPDPAHAERFGIFVGLWAPTFFVLSNRFDRYALSKA